jgi:Ser/Thr protein kinase RdoA (MazF antagonist)
VTDLVHGMGTDLVVPDWPAITADEAREVLANFSWMGTGAPYIVWRSPRPMSGAAIVRSTTATVFVKRHHVAVRSTARLEREHEFARHLRDHGVSVPAVLSTTSGESVVKLGEYVYEVHDTARGVDAYRDVPSWFPFASVHHASSAGRALALFHAGAREFAAPAWNPEILNDSMAIIGGDDPERALLTMIERRGALSRALDHYEYEQDLRRWLVPAMEQASPLLRGEQSQWTHGDWHASNLTWSTSGEDAAVADVLDLGLSNRTTAVRDLAIAVERNCVDWLDINQVGSIHPDYKSVDALLDGYEELSPLSTEQGAALIALLPVSHVEFALSEIEYFADVVHSAANTNLAYEGFLLGHAQWFQGPLGTSLLSHLGERWSVS